MCGKIYISFFSLCMFLTFYSYAPAQATGGIAGKVIDVQKNSGIPRVLIRIEELDSIKYTGNEGLFEFRDIPEGSYTIILQATGYGRTIFLGLPVISNEVVYKQFYLQKSAEEGEKFYIGGIEVSAERELLPENAVTTTSITSGEIEHLQASSLGDVLELIPGQKFTNPGLEDVKQISLRQTPTDDEADRNAALGTQVVIDNIPLSNNANMQLDTKLNDGATYRITVNSGIDLRRVPAENIRSVEVIRGIPPAKYGDLSSGTILVNTASGYVPYRMKYKFNPRNKELNASGGHGWESMNVNFNFNYANSRRDIRISGDSYSRLAGQLNLENYFSEKKLFWGNRFYYIRTFDEQDVREGDLFATERYNRDYTARWNSELRYNWNSYKKLEAIFAATMDRQNSYYKKYISRDAGVISDRMTPGTQEGTFVSYYQTELQVKGRAWNLFGRLEYNSRTHTGRFLHLWQSGLNIQYEFNNGPGRLFDPSRPPQVTDNEGDRPRRYDDIPGLGQYTLYVQDEIVGHIWRDFNLQLGLRLEMLDPYRWNFDLLKGGKFPLESRYGTFLSPRINFIQYLGKNTQIRLGYGRNVKAPPLSMIYPNPVYFDVVDSMYYDPNVPENRLAIVTTYIYDRTNREIRAFSQDKYEASIDRKIGNVGFSLTGYSEKMHNGFELSGFIPVSFPQYNRPDWPALQPAIARDTLLLDYRQAINSVESRSRGLELAVTTKPIPLVNTILRIDAAYHHTKSWWQNNHFEYASTLRKDPYLQEEIRPFWNPVGSWSDNLIIHYRMDTMARSLGLWFTVAIQQVALERDKMQGLEDSLAVGYVKKDGTIYIIPEENRADPVYRGIRRPASSYLFITESFPNLWLINLRVSKSLWKGSEVSFFVNNMFNYQPLVSRDRVPEGAVSYLRRNPDIFYGMEFSMVIDDFIDVLGRY
jgi:hypothetical protein